MGSQKLLRIDLLFVLAVTALLFAPSLAYLLGAPAPTITRENRKVPPPPRFGSSSLAVGINKSERYFRDTFRLRSELLVFNNFLRFFVLHTPTSKNAFVGQAGQLFYREQGNFNRHLERHPLTEKELALWVQALARRTDWLARRNAKYVFIVIPDPHTIISDLLPSYLQLTKNPSRFSQLADAVSVYNRDRTSANQPIEFHSLHQALHSKKQQGETLFYTSDTHWNALGSYYGYVEVMNILQTVMPDYGDSLIPISLDNFDIIKRWREGDFSILLGLPKFIAEEAPFLMPKSPWKARIDSSRIDTDKHFSTVIPNSELSDSKPTAVVFRDSFTRAFRPLLSEHFRSVRYLWLREFEREWIEHDKPELVLHLFAERFLYTDLPSTDDELID